MEGRDVDVMGYADPEKQAKYKELSKKKFKAQAQLRKLERSDRYKIARANELAKEMGIDTGDGNVKFTAEGHVPTVINGKAVDQSLLTEREKQKIGAAQEMRSAFEGRKTSSLQTDPVTETANPAIKQAELNNPNTTPLSQAQGEAIIAELKENNRLSRKQTDTIENTA